MLLLVLATGCIKEDMEPCDVNLIFRYLGDGTKDIFPEKIKKLDLYVYGESEALIETISLDQGDLKRFQGTSLILPAGKYRVVCWGNSESNTLLKRVSALSTAVAASPHYFTKELITTNDSLYFGSRTIEIFQDNSSADTVYFSSSHIKMRIELDGLEDVATDDGYSPVEIEVGNLKPAVDFTHTFSSEKVSYWPIIFRENETSSFKSRFNVLRFNDDNDVYINIIDKASHQTIYTLLLKDFMKENQITVDGINEATIGIRFRFNGTSITVSPWDEEVITPGIG